MENVLAWVVKGANLNGAQLISAILVAFLLTH